MTLMMVGLVPMPTRAKVTGLAAVAARRAHAWAMNAGLYPPALARRDDAVAGTGASCRRDDMAAAAVGARLGGGARG